MSRTKHRSSQENIESRVTGREEMAVPRPSIPVPVNGNTTNLPLDSNISDESNSIHPSPPLYSPSPPVHEDIGPQQPILRKKQRSDFKFGKLLGEGSYSEVRIFCSLLLNN